MQRTTSGHLLIVMMFVSLLAFGGCDKPAVSETQAAAGGDPPLGKACTAEFRRDMLGMAASLPAPPMTDRINGADVSVSGKLVQANAGWIVLETDGKTLWIPRENVLLLEFPR